MYKIAEMPHYNTHSIIRTLRVKKLLSQVVLRSWIGVNRRTINNWEHHRSEPSISFCVVLGNVLGIPWYAIAEEYAELDKTKIAKKGVEV